VTRSISECVRAIAGQPKVSLHRVVQPEKTLEAITPLFRPAGLTRIADVTGLDCIGIPVVMVVRPNARSLSVSQGKGIDLASAHASGAMEALELYHAERVALPMWRRRWSELAVEKAVDPYCLPLRKEFTPETPILWVQALEVISDTGYLVPCELVHADFTLPRPPGYGFFHMSSNGLASGNTFAEAILHALCELIERDALVACKEGSQTRRIELSSITDPLLQQTVERIQNSGCTLTVEDLTPATGVPIFRAVIMGGYSSVVTKLPAGGLGCHPSPVWACMRAITEAAQSRLTRISGSRDDLTKDWFEIQSQAQTAVNEEGISYQFPVNAGFLGEYVEQDLQWVIERLLQNNYKQILVVDLSQPEFSLPVVRVIVPGLRHPAGLH
jgi:YcaO-like protein with predicted kinase domain